MKNKKTKVILAVLGILLIMVLTIAATYAVFSYNKLGNTINVIKVGNLDFIYTENTGVGRGINITNAYPISDEEGKNIKNEDQMFDFTLEGVNGTKKDLPYEITLSKSVDSTLPNDVVKVYLSDITGTETEVVAPVLYSNLEETVVGVGSGSVEKTLYQGAIPTKTEDFKKDYRLRMWVDENTDFSAIGVDDNGDLIYPYNNKTFTLTVNVYSGEDIGFDDLYYKEDLLNGADPVLASNSTVANNDSGIVKIANTESSTKLIPVIVGNDGSVVKADTTKKWYSYADKEWANAVILKDENISYKNGESIPESNIESYFVWIPKYSYKLFNLGNYTAVSSTTYNKTQIIDIKFGLDNTSDLNNGECTTPMTAGATGNCAVGEYMTHPAFLSFDSNGFWVGKFETGYDGATSKATSQVDSVDVSKIIIKPNVYSWKTLTMGKKFKNCYDYQRELDSHMMKNTEWGAVAYLQHSSYGSAISLRVNNNSNMITGFSAVDEPTKGYNTTSASGNRFQAISPGADGTYTINYLNPSSVVSSTTGNYTGIYDMSGGSLEYVMGFSTKGAVKSSDLVTLYSDFFTNDSWKKYYDEYTSTATTNYNNRILGDATGEMGPFKTVQDPDGTNRTKSSWYNDWAFFASTSGPWFYRGTRYLSGTGTGMFAFYGATIGDSEHGSYRIVLTPKGGNN